MFSLSCFGRASRSESRWLWTQFGERLLCGEACAGTDGTNWDQAAGRVRLRVRSEPSCQSLRKPRRQAGRISGIERERRNPGLNILVRLAKALNVSLPAQI